MAIEDFTVRLKANVKNYIKGVRGASDATDGLTDAQRKLGTSNKKLSGESKRAGASAKKLESSFSRLSANTIALNQATQLLTTSYLLGQRAVAGLVRPYADYEKALIGVGKTTNLAGVQLKTLGNNLKAVSEVIPVSTNELLEIGEAAGQLGVSGASNIQNFAETIAKLGSASNLSGEEAATSLTRILNVTGTAVDQVDEFASAIVALGNSSAANERDIARMATEVAKATNLFGVSAADAAALGAAMKSVGIQAELGGSSVGKAFRTINAAIQTGGEELEALTALTGQSAEQLEQAFAKDATMAFQTFLSSLNKLPANQITAELEKFGLKGDEIAKTLPVLAKRVDLVTKAIDISRNEMENATALNEEAARAFASLDSQIKITQNVFSNLRAEIGERLEPIVTSFLTTLRALAPTLKAAAASIAAVDVSGLVNTIKETAGVLTAVLVPAILVLNPALITMAATLGVMAIKFIAIAAVIGGVVVAIDLLVRNAHQMGEVFTVVINSIRLGFLNMGKFVINIFAELIQKLVGGVGRLAAVFSDDLANSINGVKDTIKDLNSTFQAESKTFGEELKASVTTAASGLDLGIIGNIIDQGKIALEAFNTELEKSQGLSSATAGNLQDMQAPGGGAETPETVRAIPTADPTAFLAGPQAFVDAAQGIVDAIPNLLFSFAGLLSSITNLPMILTEAVGAVIDASLDLLTNFIPNIVAELPKIVDKLVMFLVQGLPQALEGLADQLPILVEAIVDAIPVLIEAIIKAVPKIALALLKLIPALLKATFKLMINGLTGLIKGIVKGLSGGAMELVGGMAEGAKTAFKNLEESLTGASSQLFSVVEGVSVSKGQDQAGKIGKSITQATSRGVNDLERFWKNTFGNLSVSGLGTTLDHFWKNTFGHLSVSGLGTTLDKFWAQTFGNLSMSGLGTTLDDFWKNTFGSLSMSGIATTLEDFWKNTFGSLSISGIAKVLEDFWKNTFGSLSTSGIATSLQDFWDSTFGAISTSGITTTFQDAWDSTFGALSMGGLKTTFEDMGNALGQGLQKSLDFLKDLLGKALKPITALFKGIGDALSNIFNGEKIKAAFQGLGDVIGDAITGILRAYLNPLIDLFNKLKIPKTDVGGKILGRSFSFTLLPELDLIPGTIAKFAEGGVVPGNASVSGNSDVNDKVLAFLSPGEIVIPRSVTQNESVMQGLASLISGDLPSFQMGGLVPGGGFSDSITPFINQVSGGNRTESSSSAINIQDGAVNITVQADRFDEDFIRNDMMEIVKESLREATNDGQSIISSRGVF